MTKSLLMGLFQYSGQMDKLEPPISLLYVAILPLYLGERELIGVYILATGLFLLLIPLFTLSQSQTHLISNGFTISY